MVETRKTAVPSYKELSDSDSDPYEHKPSSSVRRKRQRTKKTRKTAAATDAKSTTAFWTVLPLDLVHEIFRCLEPIDLLQLARSNKGLRDHLMSKGASLAVWRASRQNVIGGTPPCPDDMSEPQFARLLFAIECFVCGRTPKLWSGHKCGYQVYWETRIRCCDMCSSASFMSNIKIARKFPDIENIETALELLSSHGTGPSWRRTRYYYTPAVYDVMAIIEDFENRTLARMPRVKEDFEEYKTVQKAKVAAILEAAEIYRTWSEKRRDTIHLLDVELQRRWKEVFTAKLLALGHDLVDIQESYWLFEMRRQWTEENWNVIRTRAVDVVTKKKADRLKSIRNNLIARRQKVATQVLKSHPSQANIEPNLFNPALDEIISNLGAMKRVVFRKDDMEVTPEDFEGALDGVEEWVEGWRIERRAKLLEIMVSAGASQIGEAPMELDFDRLRLATTMFFCSTPRRYAAGAQKALCLASVTQHTATRRCGKEGPDWSPACLSYSTDAEEMIWMPRTRDFTAKTVQSGINLPGAGGTVLLTFKNTPSLTSKAGFLFLQQIPTGSYVKRSPIAMTIALESGVYATISRIIRTPTPFAAI
ncbi:hypothetical protein FRB96_003081 [Tulasnella sp. 330]|nr:hypothetical protein FRB96_003081 [Tulasnella sp. 330]